MTHDRTKKILVLLDGSPLSECTLPHAVKLATATGAAVLLLIVKDEPAPRTGEERADSEAAREAHMYLGRLAELVGYFGIDVETQFLEGHPAELALEVARVVGADVILLGTHGGRTGKTEFPLSGTASKILSAAATSVLVAPSEESPTSSFEAPYTRILAPVDLTAHADASARMAAALARSEGSELVLVTVVPVPEVLNESPEVPNGSPEVSTPAKLAGRLAALNRGSAERHLTELANELVGEGLQVRSRIVEEADVAQALEVVADEEDASLVVLGAHGRSEDREHAHGAVTTRLLEHVTRPVLVFQNGSAGPAETLGSAEGTPG